MLKDIQTEIWAPIGVSRVQWRWPFQLTNTWYVTYHTWNVILVKHHLPQKQRYWDGMFTETFWQPGHRHSFVSVEKLANLKIFNIECLNMGEMLAMQPPEIYNKSMLYFNSFNMLKEISGTCNLQSMNSISIITHPYVCWKAQCEYYNNLKDIK